MKYKRFEDLPVWQAAVDFALLVCQFTNIADMAGLGDTKGQLERCSLSVSNNIAEGFERGNSAELMYFLDIARGSVGGSRSMLCLCEHVPRFSNFRSEISNLKSKAENISKQLYGWLESLKNNDIKSVRFLTPRDRARSEHNERLEEFDLQMEEFHRQHQESLGRRERDSNGAEAGSI